ncbi:MAG: DUF6150 family protein [Bacteroidota bacterium]
MILRRQISFVILLFYHIFFACTASAQTVFSVQYASQADVKVFVVEYESQADLVVYKAKYKSEAKGNEGLWHFVEYASQARKKLFFVDYASQADLRIFFTPYKSKAGWRNKQKQLLIF